jgi:phosphonopyruvate decarboxylase
MINPANYLDSLNTLDVNFFAGVPDSLLKEFCACVSEKCEPDMHLITANEGAAVGLGIGYFLGTGNIPMIYLQNSGLGNIINPVLSLASEQVYGVPMLIMVGWRGEPGVKDEPQHIHQGRVMIDSLEGMNLPYVILATNEKEAIEQTQNAASMAREKMSPIFILVRKNSFESFPIQRSPCDLELSREDAIITVAEMVPAEGVVVCTTGMASRELYEFRANGNQGHHRDFLTVGGMGHASQIALGLCKAQPERSTYCFDGDGAVLMHMGSLAIIGQSSAVNYTHIVFNNGVHDSVGGQPTLGFDVNFCGIARNCGYVSAIEVESREGIKKALAYAGVHSGPHFIDVHVRSGNRSDIGRPKTTPLQNKNAIMSHLGACR